MLLGGDTVSDGGEATRGMSRDDSWGRNADSLSSIVLSASTRNVVSKVPVKTPMTNGKAMAGRILIILLERFMVNWSG